MKNQLKEKIIMLFIIMKNIKISLKQEKAGKIKGKCKLKGIIIKRI